MHDAIVSHHPFTEPVRKMHDSLILYAKALVIETEAMVVGRRRDAHSNSHMESHQKELHKLEAEYDVRFSYVAYGTDTDLHREDIDTITSLSPSARVAIAPRLVWAFDFSDGLAVVEFGMTDESGERRYGYIDADCNLAIPKAFATASRFEHGVARVRPTQDGPWGLIDKSGEYVIEPKFCAPPVTNDNGITKIGVNCTAARPFGTPALMDEKGHVVRLPKFDYLGIGHFSEGLAYACRDEGERRENCGYIDQFGEVRIPVQYEMANDFCAGLAAVLIKGRWGYINKEGRLVIQAQFGEAYPFTEGLALVAVEKVVGPYGFIDRAGRFVIKPTFARAGEFSDGRGLIAVDTSDASSGYFSYGFIDRHGNMVVEPQYDSVRDFSDGYAAVMQDDVWGFIDTSGNVVILPQFEDVGDCSEGMAWFVVNRRYGYVRFN